MFDVTPVTSRREVDCGPTCLKMLLAYYGIGVPLDQLIAECGENVWGCTAKDLMVAGGLHGLGMTAYHVDADELLGLDRPSIIWWRRNHWCVLCGVRDDGRVEICQPDRGKFSVSKGSFESLYAGVAIFNGEPHDNGEPEPVTVSDLADAMADISVTVSDNADAIADLSEVVSDLAGGDING